MLKHYKDGEFHKDYDRSITLKSMVTFLRDPTGQSPVSAGYFLSFAFLKFAYLGLWIRLDLMQIRIRIRIQHLFHWRIRILIPRRIRILIPRRIRNRIQFQIQGFDDDQKLNKIYSWKFSFLFFGSKIAIYLSLGLPKGGPSYRRSRQS